MLRKIKKKQGFTLVEIMIVVAIIVLLAAISIHSLMRARMTANEAAAIKGLRILSSVFVSYRAVNPTYPDNFEQLIRGIPPYLDTSWQLDPHMSSILAITYPRQGYIFDIKYGGEDVFFIMANPSQEGVTGYRGFSINQDGEILSGGVGLMGAASPE